MTAAEVIHPQTAVVVLEPAVVVEQGFGLIATCTSSVVAQRLAELWSRYGLVDVPDTAEGVLGTP